MSSLLQSRWAQVPAQNESDATTTPTTQQQNDGQAAPVSTLSAVAATFSPAPDSQDEFAQTGAVQDDLFDDFTEEMQTRPADDLFDDDFTPLTPVAQSIQERSSAPVTASVEASQQMISPQRSEPRTRGRGRGRGGAARGSSDRAIGSTRSGTEQVGPQAPENAPTGPKKETQPAVRGDRQATGGVKKPKLSEAELADKMAQISLKNASLAAAHARAEADAASFEQREAQAKVAASKRSEAAKVRAREERQDRQRMIGEREKNRMRKLKAMEGREWDAEKNEDDFNKGGQYDKKDSFAGNQLNYTDGREYLLRDARPTGATRGDRKTNRGALAQQHAPRTEDFPALPGATAASLSVSAGEAAKSWADQVESSATA